MAILSQTEGFDDGVIRATLAGTVLPVLHASAARTGPYGLRCQTAGASASSYFVKSFANVSSAWVDLAFKCTLINNQTIMQFQDSNGVAHLNFKILTAGTIEVRRGNNSGTVIATSTFVYTVGTWVHMQIKFVIDDASGVVQVRFNGSGTNDIDFAGDTRNAGLASVASVLFGVIDTAINSTGAPHDFDDLIFHDTTGSAPENTWLGDSEVAYLFPNAAGDSSQGTIGGSSPAATRHESLDETPPDEGVTTVEFTSSGDLLLMNYQDLAITAGTVYAVIPVPRAQKTAAGNRQFRPVSKLAGVTMNGSNFVLSTSWVTFVPDVWHDDPSGAAWTATNINSAQFGVQLQV